MEWFAGIYLIVCCILLGPGLAIRVICGEEPYQGNDFAETNIILGQIVDYDASLSKVTSGMAMLKAIDDYGICDKIIPIMWP